MPVIRAALSALTPALRDPGSHRLVRPNLTPAFCCPERGAAGQRGTSQHKRKATESMTHAQTSSRLTEETVLSPPPEDCRDAEGCRWVG